MARVFALLVALSSLALLASGAPAVVPPPQPPSPPGVVPAPHPPAPGKDSSPESSNFSSNDSDDSDDDDDDTDNHAPAGPAPQVLSVQAPPPPPPGVPQPPSPPGQGTVGMLTGSLGISITGSSDDGDSSTPPPTTPKPDVPQSVVASPVKPPGSQASPEIDIISGLPKGFDATKLGAAAPPPSPPASPEIDIISGLPKGFDATKIGVVAPPPPPPPHPGNGGPAPPPGPDGPAGPGPEGPEPRDNHTHSSWQDGNGDVGNERASVILSIPLSIKFIEAMVTKLQTTGVLASGNGKPAGPPGPVGNDIIDDRANISLFIIESEASLSRKLSMTQAFSRRKCISKSFSRWTSGRAAERPAGPWRGSVGQHLP